MSRARSPGVEGVTATTVSAPGNGAEVIGMIATAPGKLILTGEYAVLDGAPALVVAVDRRVSARRRTGPRGSSPFLVAVADEIARAYGDDSPAAAAPRWRSSSIARRSSSATPSSGSARRRRSPSRRPRSRSPRSRGAVPVIDRDAVQAIAIGRARHRAERRGRGRRARISAAAHALDVVQRSVGARAHRGRPRACTPRLATHRRARRCAARAPTSRRPCTAA